MKKAAFCAVLSILTSAPAFSADIQVGSAPLASPAAYNWSGFYVGGTAGYGGAGRVVLGHLDDNPLGAKPVGGFLGAEVGYNHQIGNVVVGLAGDFQFSGIRASSLDRNFGDLFVARVDQFGSLRGRVGLAYHSALVYATAGLAVGHVVSTVGAGGGLNGSPYALDRVAVGYTVGAGLEYALNDRWSAKVEYQYVNLGLNDPTNAAGNRFSAVLGREILNQSAFHTVRIGVNYRFGGPTVPVVARY